MQILHDILLRIEDIRKEAEKPMNIVDPIPSGDELSQYVQELWDDSELFLNTYYSQTGHLRRSKPDEKGAGIGFSRDTWDKACEALAYGENWEHVWGHRPKNWMMERVDGEIPRKLSVRKDNITAKYHEFTVSPNIANINQIYNQERKRMGAKKWTEEFVQMAMVYGVAISEITVDYNIHPQGQVKNTVRRFVGRTPGARSFQASDGCNYVIFAETVTARQIEVDFPDVDVSELETLFDTAKRTRSRQAERQDYKHTKFYQKYRVYIDDPSVEKIPFDNEEQAELIEELQTLMEGVPVKARREQNHLEHIQAKMEAVLNFLSIAPTRRDEELMMVPLIKAHIENILEHLDFIDRNKIETLGKRQKYPHGRYICWIGGKVVQDVPNPYGVPWRKLVQELHNRSIQGRTDSAGDPEIMYREAFQSDIMRSRLEELSLLGLPQTYRNVADKQNKEVDVANDNDPLSTKYFVNTPPLVVKTEPPMMLLKLYEIAQGKSERDTNINTVARGEQPPPNTPASLVAMVQKQNRLIVTGELDRNFCEVLEDVIEGNLAVMKQIYKQKRPYVINGKVENVNISELLSVIEVGPDGTLFEVTVKPGSNYPDEWETKLTLLLDLRSRMANSVKAAALDEAIMDHLAVEYPEFAQGEKYRVLEEATRIGLQVLAERQKQEAARGEQERADRIFQGVQNQIERDVLKEQVGLGSGNGKTQT